MSPTANRRRNSSLRHAERATDRNQFEFVDTVAILSRRYRFIIDNAPRLARAAYASIVSDCPGLCYRLGRDRRRSILVPHHAGDGIRKRAPFAYAQSRQWQDHVSRGRLRVLSRSQPGGQDEARRRRGAEIAIRYFLFSEHFIASYRWDRRMERGGFHDRHVEGHLARGQALLPGIPLHLLPAHEARGCERSVRLSQNFAGGAGQGARSRSAPAFQDAAHRRSVEISVPRWPRVPARSGQIAAVESRRLSRQRS